MMRAMAKYGFGQFKADVKADIAVDSRRRPKLWFLTIWTSVRFRLLFLYRVARFLSGVKGMKMFLPYLRMRQYRLCGCEVSPRAIIGRGVLLPHPTGIIIGQGVTIEDNVTILQNVTLGHLGSGTEEDAYPVICEGVAIYAGAKIIGNVRVGKGAKVGANAVVLKDVPDGYIAVGIPAQMKAPKA